MSISILAIQADIADIVTRVKAADAAIRPILEATTKPTTASLLGLRASITGALADIRAVRDLMDSSDVLEAAVVLDGAISLALWRWERDTRLSLSDLLGSLQSADAVVALALEGRIQRQHIAIKGDTLQSLASKYLGDFAAWTRIADLNGITTGTLTPGTILDIPER